MTLVLLAFAGCVAGIIMLVLLDRVIRDPGAMAIVLLVLAAIAAALGETPRAALGGFAVTVDDVVTVLILGALVARLLRRAPVPQLSGLLSVILALAAWSLLRGIGEFGLATAVNESRGTFSFYLTALYFATALPDERLRSRIAQAWVACAMFLSALALVRWAAVLGPLPAGGHWYNPGEYGGLRVLWSDESFLLAQAFVIMMRQIVHGSSTRYHRAVTTWIFVTLVVTQHRSVWAAALLGIAVLLLLEGNLGRTWGRRLLIAVSVVAVLLLTLFSGPLQERAVVETDATGTSTFEWRVEGWTSVYRDAGPTSFAEAMVGRPFGAGYRRRLISLGYTTDVVPHNHYISTSLRLGVVGVTVLIALYVLVIQRLRVVARASDPHPMLGDRTLVVLLTMQMLYYIPYWPAPEQGIFLGLGLAAIRSAWVRASQHHGRDGTASNDDWSVLGSGARP